jgi:hypothetical protein
MRTNTRNFIHFFKWMILICLYVAAIFLIPSCASPNDTRASQQSLQTLNTSISQNLNSNLQAISRSLFTVRNMTHLGRGW